MKLMRILKYPDDSTLKSCLLRPYRNLDELRTVVQPMLENIKKNGDKAVFEYEKTFDKVELQSLKVTEKEFKDADECLENELKAAISYAYQNIFKFHFQQLFQTKKVTIQQGVTCWQKAVPIEKVGLYVPGGSAPLFSTVLMLAIPATIAGCSEIVLTTPPDKNGKIHPAILYAAKMSGIHSVYKIGGAQAIGAMAYGTETVPKVYKIFGPGNQYVTAAKQFVSLNDVSIDMPAGPSEVAIVADSTANPVFVAADILSQAEHGPDSQSVLITTSEELLNEVAREITVQLEQLPRKSITEKALEHSAMILVKDRAEMIKVVNDYAPEHLIVAVENYMEFSEHIVNAGSVFLGNYSCESAGDYASGTNHTLPTNGHAKSYSGVNVDSFSKKITFQELTHEGILSIGRAVEVMAANELLDAHKNAMTVRIQSLK